MENFNFLSLATMTGDEAERLLRHLLAEHWETLRPSVYYDTDRERTRSFKLAKAWGEVRQIVKKGNPKLLLSVHLEAVYQPQLVLEGRDLPRYGNLVPATPLLKSVKTLLRLRPSKQNSALSGTQRRVLKSVEEACEHAVTHAEQIASMTARASEPQTPEPKVFAKLQVQILMTESGYVLPITF